MNTFLRSMLSPSQAQPKRARDNANLAGASGSSSSHPAGRRFGGGDMRKPARARHRPYQVGPRPLKGRLDQLLLLTQMDLTRAGCGAGAGVPTDVGDVGAGDRSQAWLHEKPAAHVLRLLLHPGPLLRLAIAADHLTDRLLVERVELFHPHDRDTA